MCVYVCWVCISVKDPYLSFFSFLSFLLGKYVGEEAVSLNPACAESHQWWVFAFSFTSPSLRSFSASHFKSHVFLQLQKPIDPETLERGV